MSSTGQARMPRIHQNELSARVASLLERTRVAHAAGDAKALTRFRDEGAQLQLELAPLVEAGDLQAAELLFEVAYIGLPLQVASRNWWAASGACALLGGAVAAITQGITYGAYTEPERRLLDLMTRMRSVAEGGACAAHHAGNIMVAVTTLEVQTGILFDMLMSKTAGRAVQRRMDARLVGLEEVAEYGRRTIEPWLADPPGNGPADYKHWVESAVLASQSVPDRNDPLEQFFLTPPYGHAVRAAQMSKRTIVYVVPGFWRYDGVAVRVNPDTATGSLAESTWLPGLQGEALNARLEQIRTVFKSSGGRARMLSHEVEQILDWTGKHVWDAIAERWPDLLARPLAVIPVSRAALLPIFTATFHGDPACTQFDVTIAPSARALHFAALPTRTSVPASAYVAADAWHGVDTTLKSVNEEATAIAAIYGTEPILYRTGSQAASSPNPEVAQRLRTATVAHLTCHGKLDGTQLSLLLGGVVSLNDILDTDNSVLPGRPLVVLSACELGGFADENIAAEQYGFPAGLLAIGARTVIGALWPVPDAPAIIQIMESFHRHLASLPPQAALSEAIAQARRADISPLFWGSLSQFGA